MELLDAIEELERPAHPNRSSPPIHDYDCVERQVLFVQQKLRDVWQRKRGSGVDIPRIPFNWVFSKLLRLIVEYPDGLTEAVVVTEMVKLLQQKEAERDVGAPSKKRKIRDEEDMGDLLAEGEQEALQAKVTGYGNHRLTIEMENVKDVMAHMYLHQRFRSCVDFLHQNLQYEPSAATFPFQTGREVAFTNAKLLERKEVDMGPMNGENNHVKFTLLPTGFLTAKLDEKRPLDRRLLADSITLSRVDQLVGGHQDPSVIQQLMLKAKVLDIGAIRPCQTPLYVHRQVILLGEAEDTIPRIPPGATPNTQRMTQGLHLMVLWDDQVALSRLFRVGDTLSIFHPFVHVCDQRDTEILHILNEYSSQQRLVYYFEYGSATVLFCQPSRVATTKSPAKNRAVSQGPSEVERPLSRLEDIKSGWHNFSLYAHVRSIKVSHGIPLLAAFFYAYYDPKTNQPGATNAKMQQPPPPLDRTIVSKYYLVVMLQVYLPSSNRLMAIEITGENALVALRLVPGQSVFLDGLVVIDMKSKPVRRFRERALMPSATAPASAPVEFAFPTKMYSNSSDSGVVVLCSDWASIFGKQSLFSTNSNLTVVNTTPGLMNTVLDRSKALDNGSAHALKMVETTVTGAGWLIPSANGYTIDSTCEKGHSTTCAHKFCFRPLEIIPREQRTAAPPKWKCSFCQEVFFGMEDTVQTYRELAVTVETGRSQTSPVIVLCQGDTVESLLGLPAEDYVQLSLADKRRTVDSVTGSAFRLLLSRCEALQVSMAATPSPSSPRSFDTSSSIEFRMDMAQPVDTFAAAHQLLAALQQRL